MICDHVTRVDTIYNRILLAIWLKQEDGQEWAETDPDGRSPINEHLNEVVTLVPLIVNHHIIYKTYFSFTDLSSML